MDPQTIQVPAPVQVMRMLHGAILERSLYAAAKFGVADALVHGPQNTADLAKQLKVNEGSLFRTLRALASHGIFSETAPRTFENTDLSLCLASSTAGSIRSLALLWGSGFVNRCLSELDYTIETGEPSRSKLFGPDGWAYMQQNPDLARLFDDAMTDMCSLVAPAIAASYDFGAWEELVDVGGGNGVMLAAILRAHPALHGVLADQKHVLERAEARGFLKGDVAPRVSMKPCNFLEEVPRAGRAYVLKTVLIDWDDDHSLAILKNVRKAVPHDGALLLVESSMPEGSAPSTGKFADIAMMVTWGSTVRTKNEFESMLSDAGFRLNRTIETPVDFTIFEAVPR